MPANTSKPTAPTSGSLAGPTLGAAFAFADQDANALRRLLALLRLATSIGAYRAGGTTPTLAALGGLGNIAGGIASGVSAPTATGKASGAVSGALGATQLGAAAGVPAARTALPYAGPALAGAGLGLSLADIAGRGDLSTKQKVGRGAETAFSTGFSFVPVAGQIYAAAKGIEAIGNQLQRSGSPQVRGAGRGLSYAATPGGEKAFWSVARGDMSPKAAFRSQGGLEGLMLDTMGPVGAIMRGLGFSLPGLGNTQTTGTKFRNEAKQLFSQIPELKGTDTSKYNIDPNVLNALSPNARATATTLADQLVGYAPSSKSNTEAYRNQLIAMLLNRFGNAIPTVNLQ